MPLYEYACRKCSNEFEVLVRPGSGTPTCPSCGGVELDKLITSVAVSSEGTREANIAKARKLGAKANRDKNIAQFEYEEKHRHHH